MTMKILVTGADGQLGYDVMKELQKQNVECVSADRKQFDITDRNAVENFIANHHPTAVIHCSAYTAVDKAEDERELCHRVNVTGTENIAEVCKKIDAKMLYISTDYVFDGKKEGLYAVDDIPDPQNIYGKTKLEGELAVKRRLGKYFIVRTSWIFGNNGSNFVKTMLQLGLEKQTLNIVADQIGSPTYTVDLAKLLVQMVQTEKFGVYHATNEGFCSWAEFAETIFTAAKMDVKVNHILTEEYLTKAQRPKNSRLSKEKLIKNGFQYLPYWKNSLKCFINDFKLQNNCK